MTQDIYVIIEHLQGNILDISYVMLAAAKELSVTTGGNVTAVLLGENCKELSSDLNADTVLYIEHKSLAHFTSDAYQNALTDLIEKENPRVVMFGNTSIGSDIAGVISARLGLPLINSCKKFENGKYISQICGGKINVEGDLPEPTALITLLPGGYKLENGKTDKPPEITQHDPPSIDNLRIKFLEYIEPDTSDVDISNEKILVSVGRGIQTEDNIELIEELAQALGGTVCASRPVVDQGWLPSSRMVGKSGKSVKPKIYLAIGISGAPEHVEGITESDTIIAINTDPTAPIFEIADYGSEIDLFDFVEVLTEMIKEA